MNRFPNPFFREHLAFMAVIAAMRSSFALMFACAFLGGCASAPVRPSVESVSVPRSITEVPATSVPEAAPIPRRIPTFGAACPLFFPRREVGSVVRIPANMMSLAMDPVMHALCACTKAGEYATIVAEIDFGRGRVQVRAPESSTVHQCLETLHVTFDPVPESDVPTSDCINCGPRYYGVFGNSPPPPQEPGIRLLYSFLVDRSSEVLDCPGNTHAERGQCVANVVDKPPPREKKTCGCDPTDLNCAMTCAATK
jgi:hypothetical protein